MEIKNSVFFIEEADETTEKVEAGESKLQKFNVLILSN